MNKILSYLIYVCFMIPLGVLVFVASCVWRFLGDFTIIRIPPGLAFNIHHHVVLHVNK